MDCLYIYIYITFYTETRMWIWVCFSPYLVFKYSLRIRVGCNIYILLLYFSNDTPFDYIGPCTSEGALSSNFNTLAPYYRNRSWILRGSDIFAESSHHQRVGITHYIRFPLKYLYRAWQYLYIICRICATYTTRHKPTRYRYNIIRTIIIPENKTQRYSFQERMREYIYGIIIHNNMMCALRSRTSFWL